MKNLIKKIPITIWVIILTIIAFFIVKENVLIALNKEQIRLFSSFLTFIGLVFVAINIQHQWKNDRIKTEYLNQPDFLITGFGGTEFEGSAPTLCPNPEECIDDHWFDLKQIGNLASRKLSIGLFTDEEANTNINIPERWLKSDRLGKNDVFQYKLPQFKIPFTYYKENNRMRFFLLLDYQSEYSNIRYKRVYHLWASPMKHHPIEPINDWKNKIIFYNSTLIWTNDTESITIKQSIQNIWFSLAKWTKLKKDFNYKEWSILV